MTQALDDSTAYTGQLADLFARVVSGPMAAEVLRGIGVEGMTSALLAALECLYRRGTAGVGDLAHDLGVTYAAASQFAARLGRMGLVLRSGDDLDRRRATLRLSAEGERAARAAEVLRIEQLEGILARMAAPARDALVDGLESFLYYALDDAATVERLCGRCRIEHSPECVVNRVAVALTGREATRRTS